MKRFFLLYPIIFFLFISCTEKKPEPPKAKIIPHTTIKHGVELVDNYHWLKDKSRTDIDVINYIKAENEYTEKMMKHTEKFQHELFNEITGRIKKDDLTVPVKSDSFYYYSRKEKDKQYSIYCRKKWNLESPEEIYLDANELAKGHSYFSISEFSISPNHKYLAYAADTTGAEKYTIYIKDLQTSKNLKETFFPADDLTWASDNKTFFYTIEDETGRSYQVFRHSLGTNPDNDELIFHEKDKAFYVWTTETTSEEYIIICSGSKTTRENWFLKADNPFGKFRVMQKRQPGMKYYIEHRKDKFYIWMNADNSKNNKIMVTSVDNPDQKYWKEFIAHRDSVNIRFQLFKDYMVLFEREKGIRKLRILNMNSGKDYYVEFPEPIYSFSPTGNWTFDTEILRFYYESMVTPYSIYDFNMKTRERIIKKRQQIIGGYDPEKYYSVRIYAKAEDGTSIPISLLFKKDLYRKNEPNLLLLDAYGSYGDASDPYFSISRLSLLDRGFIYAIAHVRGGGEFGKEWHDQGKMLNKKNTFTDFIACAEYLISENYTDPEKLVIEGGSAGGLLVGAVTNMRPDLFKVVIADVPFVDVLNTMLDPTLSATVSEYDEWGNPNDKIYFDYIRSYCPYQNVQSKNYPNILVLAGFHDPRVNYWEPAKWTAKLRNHKTDNNLLLLKTDMSAGHGGASGRFDYYKEVAFKYAFIFDIFGIEK
ncbi:MAG TPA: S9 family peptidase [Candidatus Cloacimonetes bacterium]|nr:S9 family peptidase [Candidatus Cloacimonadota bacterium]